MAAGEIKEGDPITYLIKPESRTGGVGGQFHTSWPDRYGVEGFDWVRGHVADE